MNQSNNKHIEEGLILFKEGKYDESYAAFETVSKEDKSMDLPILLYGSHIDAQKRI